MRHKKVVKFLNYQKNMKKVVNLCIIKRKNIKNVKLKKGTR